MAFFSILSGKRDMEENGSQRPKSYKKKNLDMDLDKIITYAEKERSESNRSI